MSSVENLPVPVEEIPSSDVIITSEDVPTSTQDVSVTLQDPENQKENISQAGPISVESKETEAQDSPTSTDLGLLEMTTPVVSVPEEETAKDESQNEDSATDQLLDFLS
ncbi:Oidioi.mRNA.OKI2018_I69.chr1.g1777.t1.cds [Oikopleura dioica]|uniref:Oidioi.mRNA.OKI2018_I69.chr1.g1774.t1.cds n=1 Tax=Oikopleura dioica TaxID=34765 RepID=A0ABN7SY42_OIKDI|nr:Oidioi.mRNA.OKI2018_I69.chr1.g1774.t1.cds [Oikopleura dioica]CAG5105035.1 Oidioi.mRNA.OKI2018_I69.chr1.g1777.t1.cds [Oikopleura dioica]